ncbi:MAG: cytosine permease, partial [Lentisphaeria bacterium]|nr:cytosine permease [Lentisphaeria bacterium]
MKDTKQTTLLGHSLIWFGAAVSIAEILTGTLFAPLGFWKAFAAIAIGHLLGCLLLYSSGLISALNRTSAMESTKKTFGTCGGRIFAGLNVMQLVGWTAVRLATGGQAANGINPPFGWHWSWH